MYSSKNLGNITDVKTERRQDEVLCLERVKLRAKGQDFPSQLSTGKSNG